MNAKVWNSTNLKMKEYLCEERNTNRIAIVAGSYYKLVGHIGDIDHAFLTQRQNRVKMKDLFYKSGVLRKSRLILLIV